MTTVNCLYHEQACSGCVTETLFAAPQVKLKKNGQAIPCDSTIQATDTFTHDFEPPANYQFVVEAGRIRSFSVSSTPYPPLFSIFFFTAPQKSMPEHVMLPEHPGHNLLAISVKIAFPMCD